MTYTHKTSGMQVQIVKEVKGTIRYKIIAKTAKCKPIYKVGMEISCAGNLFYGQYQAVTE